VGSLLAAVSLLVTGMILSVLAHLDHLDVHSTGCTQFGDIADVLSILRYLGRDYGGRQQKALSEGTRTGQEVIYGIGLST
jgi:hypothetical protein